MYDPFTDPNSLPLSEITPEECQAIVRESLRNETELTNQGELTNHEELTNQGELTLQAKFTKQKLDAKDEFVLKRTVTPLCVAVYTKWFQELSVRMKNGVLRLFKLIKGLLIDKSKKDTAALSKKRIEAAGASGLKTRKSRSTNLNRFDDKIWWALFLGDDLFCNLGSSLESDMGRFKSTVIRMDTMPIRLYTDSVENFEDMYRDLGDGDFKEALKAIAILDKRYKKMALQMICFNFENNN
jgi:hypothetical protein